MKLFKLIKSIDYVAYPSYKELVKISDAVTNSIATFRDMLISAIIGILFDVTPLSGCIVLFIKENNSSSIVQEIVSYEGVTIFVSIFIALIIYGVINLVQFIYARWGSNKNTKKKRDIIVYEFYNVAIPQLIEVKSILEQVEEDKSDEERKKLLLILQAKYEICNLYGLLSEMCVIERDRTGAQTDNSNNIYDRISKSAYNTFLMEMLEIMFQIYTKLKESQDTSIADDIADIRTNINKTGVFDKVGELEERLNEIKLEVNK